LTSYCTPPQRQLPVALGAADSAGIGPLQVMTIVAASIGVFFAHVNDILDLI
jgi:hypothetical protein